LFPGARAPVADAPRRGFAVGRSQLDVNGFSTRYLICNILLPSLYCLTPPCYIFPMNTQNQTLSRKILVVDDDPRLRDLLRRYLSEQGFNVFVAEDAKEMGKLWQREYFDLLVLDLML